MTPGELGPADEATDFGFSTSPAIARAILSHADSAEDAAELWGSPTNEEFLAIVADAWQLAGPGTDTLLWDGETIRRSARRRGA